MSQPLSISVVIPAFNAASYIKNAIDSVLLQTLKPQEIIIIDDGSSDNLEQVIAPYKSYVKYYKQENSGVAIARNLGVNYAKSKWVAFLDADDIWHKNKLSIQARVVESSLSKNISIICTEYQFVNSVDQLALNSQPTDFSYKKIEINTLLNKPYLATPTVIINKQLFEVIGGYNEVLHTAEDLDLYLRLVMVGDVIKVYCELTHCLVSPTSLTSRHDTYDNEIEIYHSLNKDIKYHPYAPVINKHIQDCQIDKLTYLIFKRQLKAFKKFLGDKKTEIPLMIKCKLLLKYWLLRLM